MLCNRWWASSGPPACVKRTLRMSFGLGGDAPTGVSGVTLGRLGLGALPEPPYSRRHASCLSGEDKLADLVNTDRYLTAGHFTVAEELEAFGMIDTNIIVR